MRMLSDNDDEEFHDDDRELLQGVLDDDREMVLLFCEKFNGAVRKAVASVRIKDRSLTCDDLEQAAYENLFEDDKRALRLYKGECRLWTYIFIISHRHALARANRHLPPGPDPDTLEAPDKLAGEFGDGERLKLKEAIHLCKPRERMFIRIMYEFEFITRDIMDYFGWKSENTVYSEKNKIITKLKKILRRLGPV